MPRWSDRHPHPPPHRGRVRPPRRPPWSPSSSTSCSARSAVADAGPPPSPDAPDTPPGRCCRRPALGRVRHLGPRTATGPRSETPSATCSSSRRSASATWLVGRPRVRPREPRAAPLPHRRRRQPARAAHPHAGQVLRRITVAILVVCAIARDPADVPVGPGARREPAGVGRSDLDRRRPRRAELARPTSSPGMQLAFTDAIRVDDVVVVDAAVGPDRGDHAHLRRRAHLGRPAADPAVHVLHDDARSRTGPDARPTCSAPSSSTSTGRCPSTRCAPSWSGCSTTPTSGTAASGCCRSPTRSAGTSASGPWPAPSTHRPCSTCAATCARGSSSGCSAPTRTRSDPARAARRTRPAPARRRGRSAEGDSSLRRGRRARSALHRPIQTLQHSGVERAPERSRNPRD